MTFPTACNIVLNMQTSYLKLRQPASGTPWDKHVTALMKDSRIMNKTSSLYTFRILSNSALRDSEIISFRDAAAFSFQARIHRRPSTLADLRSYINRICSYPGFADTPVQHIDISQCLFMLEEQFGHSSHSFRKAQSVLHSIFAQAIRQGWRSSNPADAILLPPIHENTVNILSLREISTLLNVCKSDHRLQRMECALRLMLWCGIRPMETRRLKWSDIDPNENVVYVDSTNSKTGGARAIPLRGGAHAVLRHMDAPQVHIAPANWNRLWFQLRQKAGFLQWQNDALRHTFASMHLKHYHNLHLLQEEMGHRNAALLQTRYLNLRNLSKASAIQFFKPKEWI